MLNGFYSKEMRKMAVGTQYMVAESGWVRFEDTDPNFRITGWSNWTGADTSGGSDKRTSSLGKTIKFKFTGIGIRIISPINKDLSASLIISIDGVNYDYSQYNASLLWRMCVFEKTNLENTTHTVVISSNSTLTNIFDAVDLLAGNTILPYPQKIGNVLTSPEVGWKRYDIPTASNNTFKIEGSFTVETDARSYNSSEIFLSSNISTLTFYFKGTSLRVIGSSNTNKATDSIIQINDKVYSIGENNTLAYRALLFEIEGLEDKIHKVIIRKGIILTNIGLDCIDVNEGGEIRAPYSNFYIKTPTNYYSLEDKTLIYMPDDTEKNIVTHGTTQDKIIDLDVPYNMEKHIIQNSNTMGRGVIFKKQVVSHINKIKVNEVDRREN